MMSVLGDPYPFGRASAEDVEIFEGEIGSKLPKDYLEYLHSHNGSSFLKKIVCLSSDMWDAVSVHHVYGLHDGPDHFQLRQNWRLYEAYDLLPWKRKLRSFLVFADSTTGDLFSLNLKTGSVWLYEHDAPSGYWRMPGRFREIEESFAAFLDKLMSQAEWDDKLKGDPRSAEFQARLTRLQQERAHRVAAWQAED